MMLFIIGGICMLLLAGLQFYKGSRVFPVMYLLSSAYWFITEISLIYIIAILIVLTVFSAVPFFTDRTKENCWLDKEWHYKPFTAGLWLSFGLNLSIFAAVWFL